MNKEELSILLKKNKINDDMYSLEGGLPNEMYCLEENNRQWEVYYSERGNKTGRKLFSTEHEACVYFYDLLRKNTI